MGIARAGRFASLGLVMVLGAAACALDREPSPTGASGSPVASPPTSARDRFPDIVAGVDPSLVSIIPPDGEGSGVVWSADGVIVTNSHVVEGVDNVEFVFANGERVAAEVLASDPPSDLAVVRAERQELPEVRFASAIPPVGSMDIAIGNPLGIENSVTAGVVSGAHRALVDLRKQAFDARIVLSARMQSAPTSARRFRRPTCAAPPSARSWTSASRPSTQSVPASCGPPLARPRSTRRAERSPSTTAVGYGTTACSSPPAHRRDGWPSRAATLAACSTCAQSGMPRRFAKSPAPHAVGPSLAAAGSEPKFAASLRQLGRPVAMIAPSSVPLERVLGTEIGTVFRDLHAEHGVELVIGYGSQRLNRVNA